MSDLAATTQAIDRDLPALARVAIRRHLDLSVPENEAFLRDPDNREHHQTQWHQWGILTHSRMFLRDLETRVPCYLGDWGLRDPIDDHLRQQVDGAPKWELLRIVALLHDIGKFAARKRGRQRFHFAGHENLSRQMILCDLDLARFGLTRAQIDYVARCAGDHFVLGIVRKRAREQGSYDQEFIASTAFTALARQIRREHPDDFVEIGVLFLGDSLAKVEPPNGPSVALTQYDLNIAVAQRYLTLVLSTDDGDQEQPVAG